MPILPVVFHADGSVDVVHELRGGLVHRGTVAAAAIVHPLFPDGTPDHRFLRVPCPIVGCGSESLHPVSGGAAPELVQELFVRAYQRLGTLPAGAVARLGLPSADVRTTKGARAAVRHLADQLDGPGRYRLVDPPEPPNDRGTPTPGAPPRPVVR